MSRISYTEASTKQLFKQLKEAESWHGHREMESIGPLDCSTEISELTTELDLRESEGDEYVTEYRHKLVLQAEEYSRKCAALDERIANGDFESKLLSNTHRGTISFSGLPQLPEPSTNSVVNRINTVGFPLPRTYGKPVEKSYRISRLHDEN